MRIIIETDNEQDGRLSTVPAITTTREASTSACDGGQPAAELLAAFGVSALEQMAEAIARSPGIPAAAHATKSAGAPASSLAQAPEGASPRTIQ